MPTSRNRPAPRHCDTPSCRSFRSPTYTVLNPRTCLTIVYDNHDEKFAYYSQRKDILAPYRAPKPLLFVPEIAAQKGFEPSSENLGEIKLNHIYYEGGPVKKSRRGTKIGPSKLRNEVLPEDVEGEVVVSSPPAEGEQIALPVREAPSNTASSTSAAADAATTSASSTAEPTATIEEEVDNTTS